MSTRPKAATTRLFSAEDSVLVLTLFISRVSCSTNQAQRSQLRYCADSEPCQVEPEDEHEQHQACRWRAVSVAPQALLAVQL